MATGRRRCHRRAMRTRAWGRAGRGIVFKGNVRRERPHPRRRDAGAPGGRLRSASSRVPIFRPAPRCCGRRARRCAAPTSTSGMDGCRGCRIRSSPATCPPARWRRFAGRCADSTASTLREGDRAVFFDVHRTCGRCRACTVHRTPTRCPVAPRLRDHRSGGGGAVRRLVAGDLSRARRRHRAPARRRHVRRLHRRRLRTADRRAHPRARGAAARPTRVLVQGTGAVGLSAIALARLGGASTIVAIGAPAARLDLARAMGADYVFDVEGSTARTAARRGARADARRRGRRRDRGGRLRPRDRRRADARARRRPVRRGRPLHRRRTELGERASAHQSQAPRDPRLLGQRAGAFPAGA